MDATDILHKTDADTVIRTTGVAEQRFVDLSQTDPMAAFCFAVGVLSIVLILASIFSARLKSRFKWLGTMGGKFAIILTGAFFLLLPIAMHLRVGGGPLWPGLSQAIPAAFYFVVSMTGFSGELEAWTQVIHSIMGYGLLALLYYQVLCVYTVAAPVMLALTAVDIFANGFTGMMVFVESCKKCVLGRDIYVFYDLNENTATLASDLLDHVQKKGGRRKGAMPLLVFCNLKAGAATDGNGLAQQVREEAYGCATVVFTPLGLESIPGRLARWTQTRCNVYYLVISDDTDDNVRACIALCDAVTSQMVDWEMGARSWDVKAVGDDPALCERTRRYAEGVHVWCAHSNPDDDLIFDSLPRRRPDEQTMVRLLRHDRGTGSKEERRRAILADLSPLLVRVRNLVEVRLLSEEREVVWDTLVRHPLTEVLEPVDVSAGPVPHQKLVVLVLGLGSFGSEAVRAAFWFGRLPGVELRIVGVDKDAEAAAGRLAASWPALMAERVPAGVPSAAPGLAAPGAAAAGADGEPTVCVAGLDATGDGLRRLLSGSAVDAVCAGPDGLEGCRVALDGTSRVYTVVCLGDDELDLDVALRVQRLLSERILAGTLDGATPPQANPLVSVLVRSQEVLESIRGVARGPERFSLVPFGSTEDAFSYESILAAPWEDAAVNLQAAYDTARQLSQGDRVDVTRGKAMEDFNAYEIKKLSNRAATRFTFYRLWCLGIEAGPSEVSRRLGARWLERLGVPDIMERLAADDPDAVEALCGHRFETRGWGDDERAARRAELKASEQGVRGRHPVLAAMADLEHARWCAFLRANGWQAVPGGFEDLERTVAFVGLSPEKGLPYPHESMLLMRHYYLEDDPQALRDHGADCRDDPAAYDRLVVAEALHVLGRGYVAPTVPQDARVAPGGEAPREKGEGAAGKKKGPGAQSS